MKILKSVFTIFAFAGSVVAAQAAQNADSLARVADKAPANAALNLQAGKALLKEGKPTKARAYLNRGGNDAKPWLALIEFDNYNFNGANEIAEAYLASKHNEESEPHRMALEVIERGEIASTMLDRVEKVTVIDSIVVDKDSFFKAFKLSAPTGRIASARELPSGMKAASPTTVYVSENADRMVWGADDAKGNVHLVESSHLADGSWEAPHAIGDALGLGKNANFPFLMSDGVTLYYASDGEGSLGGYDIYVTRNDGDKYLNPQNIGMPYNSPYDDYLLAIDDATGIGWWATDRNLIPGSLTVYLFIPQELRDNYPVDGTADLIDRARISSIAATQRKGEDYSKYFEALKSLSQSSASDHNDDRFEFALPDGRVITSVSQFTEPEAQDLMNYYLDALGEFREAEAALAGLRKAFGGGDRSVKAEILTREDELEQMRQQLRHMANDVVKAELRN